MPYTQENRLLAIETPLGRDALLLAGFSGEESISKPFRFQLDMLSENPSLDFERLVGKTVTVSIRVSEEKNRYFHGYISRLSQESRSERFTRYRAEMVPWLWLLSLTSDCRIFQNMTIPEILQKVFQDAGHRDLQNNLRKTYPTRDFCVQYRESDFNFVSRLMEQYGIFYYFKHEKDRHTLVLADRSSSHLPCPDQPSARYLEAERSLDEYVVKSWTLEQELRSTRYTLEDYNFETPKLELQATQESHYPASVPFEQEIYDYPGEYMTKEEGESLAETRLEEVEASRVVSRGSSNCRGFCAGYTFELKDHYRGDLNQEHLLVSVVHWASEQAYTSLDGGGGGSRSEYSNTFTAIPLRVPFRPRETAQKPVVEGPQTAEVVGPASEEIYTDNYGRVKVQFHWDREGNRDENSSCWIRVSQNWAGKGWGGIFNPRIGQEVIVDFLEGDPDRPIITGRVYNDDEIVPYGLPSNQTQSGIKSRSTPGGGSSNFNEFRFEDRKGAEEVFLQAEKDWNTNVKNNQSTTVGANQSLTVGNNRTKSIGADESNSIGSNRNSTVGADESLVVKGDRKRTVGNGESVDIGNGLVTKIGQDESRTVGNKYKLQGRSLEIEGLTDITLKVGGNSIKIDHAGITIFGVLVKIN